MIEISVFQIFLVVEIPQVQVFVNTQTRAVSRTIFSFCV